LLLYKNDELLTKDGSQAFVESNAYPWNLSLTSYTFIIGVDGTPNATYTFNSSNLAPYTPANAPLSQWVTAFNNTVPGISAVSINNLLVLYSNKGFSSEASLSISSSGTLISIGNVFSDFSAQGSDSDYSLIRGNGQIKLTQPAIEGDNFKAGTENFQGYFETDIISGGVFNLSATGNFWFITDNETTFITTTLVVGSSLSISNPATNIWRFQASNNTFDNVQVGDWAIAWDQSLSSSNRGYWRISNVSTSTIDVEKPTGVSQSVSLTNSNSFTIVRSSGLVQQAYLPSGSYALDSAVSTLNLNLIGATAEVVNANKIRVSTNTYLSNGFIALISADVNGQTIGFTSFVTKSNGVQHFAAIESGNSELGSPIFEAALVASTTNTSSPPVFTSNIAQTISPDKMLAFVRPLSLTRYSSNRFNQTGIRNYVSNTTSLTLVNKISLAPILTNDRGYITNGYDFSYEDQLNLVIDDSPATSTLILPLYREVSVGSSPAPTVNTCNFTDVDGGNLSLTQTFGGSFDFSNYRLWSRARAVLDSTGSNNTMIIRSIHYGPTGNKYRVSVQYPTTASTAISSVISVTNGTIDNILILPSNASKTLGINITSQFSVTVSGSSPYNVFLTCSGGSAPNFVTNSITAGDILTIKSGSAFSTAVEGTFLITAVSNTGLTVSNWGYNGIPANQTVTLSSPTDLVIYSLNAPTANVAISTINNGILSQNITANLGLDSDGTGTIGTSTQDSGSGSLYVTLIDGENWVKNSTLTVSPQFTLERNLSLSTTTFYTLVGEKFRLIPYTAKQTATFLSSQAISSINNIAGLKQNDQGNKIQINSQNFGTLGAVKAASGSANSVGGSIVGSASAMTNSTLLVRSTQGATDGIHADSWIKISSALPLNKNLNFDGTTVLSITNSLYCLQITSGTGSFNSAISSNISVTTRIQIDKVGNFAAYTYNTGTAPSFNAYEGAWLNVSSTSNFSTQNQGSFRVIRSTTSTIWVDNALAVEETALMNNNSDMSFYSTDSIMPGDSIVISGSLLGSENDGTYTVESVSATSLTVSALTPFTATTAPITLGSNYGNFKAIDANTTDFYKKVYTLQDVSTVTSSLCDIILYAGTASFDAKISDVYECSFKALNKLGFDTKTFFGIDSYLAYEGLIKEASKVIYGDTSNPNTYPGVKSAGAYIDIQPPLPRKITLSIGVRLRTGVSFSTIQNNIKSVAAGVINSTAIGQSISISDILGAIRGIQGIFAVSMIYPTYDSDNDVIVINAGEKPICNASTDVSVTLLGA
jgi:hypothetical protein